MQKVGRPLTALRISRTLKKTQSHETLKPVKQIYFSKEHFAEPLDLHNKLFVILDYNQTDKVNQFEGKNLRSIPRLGLCQFTLNKHQIVIQALRPIIKVVIVFNNWLLIFKNFSYEQI